MEAAKKLTRGNRADVQPLLEEVVRVVCRHVGGKGLRMYLFGSWAQNRATSVSDLDVALDTGKPIGPAVMQKIADALDELPTLRKTDLVDLQAVGQEFRKRVLQHGELVYGH